MSGSRFAGRGVAFQFFDFCSRGPEVGSQGDVEFMFVCYVMFLCFASTGQSPSKQ